MRNPRYTRSFKDRHGHWRCYFRKKGLPAVSLPGVPWSDEFMQAYAAALAGRAYIPQQHAPTGQSIAVLWELYTASSRFTKLAASTQLTYRQKMTWFIAKCGHLPVAGLTTAVLERLLASRADTPAQANRCLSILHLMMRLAIKMGWRTDDPTAAADKIDYAKENHEPWEAAHVEAFRATHPSGTRARLAMEVMYGTMQRRSDVVRLGRQHIKGGWLAIKQQKTKTLVEVPLLPEVLREIEQLPAGQLMLLETGQGKPFTAAGFGGWFRTVCDEADVPYSAHGLRGAGAILRAEMGFSTQQIMVWGGWKTLSEVQRYTKGVDRRKLAQQGYDKLMETK